MTIYTMTSLGKRKRIGPHPYLSGNFAPIQKTLPLTPCTFAGRIPLELAGGQYVRNGGNPVSNQDLGREAHWFDGDGMLSGVAFTRSGKDGNVLLPEFVNQYILTDAFISTVTTPSLCRPLIPSIATLVNPLSTLLRICLSVFRTILLVLLSRLPGSATPIKKISVANTAVVYHDGRALATCESGPPMRFTLPSLETVGWFNGKKAEGEADNGVQGEAFGGTGILRFMKEWATAHPKIDPVSGEMVLFHSTFAPPFVHYSVLPPNQQPSATVTHRIINAPVAGVSSAKMMHDFGVSRMHTVIMDLPLTLDPLQMLKNQPPIVYDQTKPARFGVFPRCDSSQVRWFETAACCIFHVANTWDSLSGSEQHPVVSLNMLACRMTSASVVFEAGNMDAPLPIKAGIVNVRQAVQKKVKTLDSSSFEKGPLLESRHLNGSSLSAAFDEFGEASLLGELLEEEHDQCRLYYYEFVMSKTDTNKPSTEFALSTIPFEFPSTRPDKEMSASRYIYGCTTTQGTFNSALGRNARIDALVKFDVNELILRGRSFAGCSIPGCVDSRNVEQIISDNEANPEQPGPIQIFKAPEKHYLQEPRFAPAASGSGEDAGYLLTYVFDESQLAQSGEPLPSAISELWIIDAKGMKDVLAKIHLPQRVPYGLHGSWFSEEQILSQRPVERFRKLGTEEDRENGLRHRVGRRFINGVVKAIGG